MAQRRPRKSRPRAGRAAVQALSKRQQNALIDLAKQAKKSRRTRVLFSGPGGTSKTLAAEFLARQLQAPLFRVDLSKVVSKYIGETEKNLRRLFDGAEDSGAVLFLDEADALFGKRTEVKDAHDRYANIEIDYLLQRLEKFKGVAVLSCKRCRAGVLRFMPEIQCRLSFRTRDDKSARGT